MPQQGSLELLADPVASALLDSVNPARLAYTWTDGSPRVVPIWFHWTGDQFVLATPPRAPKLKALAADPRVALTIDDNAWPHQVLLVRGRAGVEMLDDVAPEYEQAATRYFGAEQGTAWVASLRGKPMARITITPEWVGVLDFQTRFPSALTA
jgi:PPOX class probable F420-dependent enzyme